MRKPHFSRRIAKFVRRNLFAAAAWYSADHFSRECVCIVRASRSH